MVSNGRNFRGHSRWALPKKLVLRHGSISFQLGKRSGTAHCHVQTLLRPFRYHNVDPVAMTRTSIYETSGSNHMAASLGLGWLWWRLRHSQGPEHEDLADFLFFVYIYAMLSFIACTNLFHRWSHMYRTPKYVNVLQATPFVIGKAHHR